MSLLDVKKTTSGDGMKKEIDHESKDVALDILQRGIYAFPIPSTIRELASNGHDAVHEREVAKSILKGESKVEDHFDLERVGGVFHASGWNPDYFDLNHLSVDNNVYIFYEEGPKRDTLRIKDNGVGLGEDRMAGYFRIGYSTKRSQKGALGKWG